MKTISQIHNVLACVKKLSESAIVLSFLLYKHKQYECQLTSGDSIDPGGHEQSIKVDCDEKLK